MRRPEWKTFAQHFGFVFSFFTSVVKYWYLVLCFYINIYSLPFSNNFLRTFFRFGFQAFRLLKKFSFYFFFPSLMIALLYGTEGILSNCISLIVKKRPFRRRVILALFTFTSNKTTRCEKVFRFTPNRYYI